MTPAPNQQWAALKVERDRLSALRGSFATIGLLPHADYYCPMELRLMRRNRLSKDRVLAEHPFLPDLLFIRGISATFARVRELKHVISFMVDCNESIIAIPEQQMTAFKDAITAWNEKVKTRYESGLSMTRRERKEWRNMVEGLAVLKVLMDEGLARQDEMA